MGGTTERRWTATNEDQPVLQAINGVRRERVGGDEGLSG